MTEIPFPPIEPAPPVPVEPLKPVGLKPAPPKPVPKPSPAPGPGGAGGGGGGLIAELAKLAMFLVVLGLLLLGSSLTKFFNWLHRFFFPKSTRQLPNTSTLLQPLSSFLGSAAASIDAEIATTFLTLRTDVDRTAALQVRLAQFERNLAARVAILTGHASAVAGASAAARAAAQTAQSTAAAAAARASSTEVTTRETVGRLERQERVATEYVHRLIEPELDRLRHRIGNLEKGQASTWSELEHVEGFFDDAAFAALVAGAIGTLGGSWIGCEATALLGEEICGLGPDLIGSLLAALLAAMLISDACAIVTAIADGATDAAPVLDLIAGGIEDLLKCLDTERPPPLRFQVPKLPPLQAPSALPALA